MKKTLMILGVLAALSMVFVGCDQPTTTEDTTGGSSSTPTTSGASATPTDDSTVTDTGSGTGSASTTTGSGTQTGSDDSSSGGSSSSEAAETVTEIYSEAIVLTGWSNGKVISETKFSSAKAGDVVRFVCEADDTPDDKGDVYHSFKIAANNSWDDAFKQFDDVSASVEYTLTAENLTAINTGDAKGLAFFGHGVKVTKVELVIK